MQKLAKVAFILCECMQSLEAVDHHDSRPKLLEKPTDRDQHSVEPILDEDATEVLVHHAPVAHGGRVEELEGLAVAEDLVEWFRDSGEIQTWPLDRRVVEDVLLAEDGLAAAGDANDHVDRVGRKPSVQDFVKPLSAAREPIVQLV